MIHILEERARSPISKIRDFSSQYEPLHSDKTDGEDKTLWKKTTKKAGDNSRGMWTAIRPGKSSKMCLGQICTSL